ncbi:putative membrane protein [Streptomyces davaonensis JCM 4913]|uniref:Putative membrane protein n=1 Tax=Streptomyces davaonensis (strain DSM 101723 / JCM 4913 / KCC S-0913 / 768) TaxID=1214101 RepID=K4RFP7_STRDJ|nr:putative membrane protein [Streptomyces davaonensis JCM 4913]
MGTSLTPEFWERFTLLLFAAMGVTFVLTALFDALALRRTIRRTRKIPALPVQNGNAVVRAASPVRRHPGRAGTADTRR